LFYYNKDDICGDAFTYLTQMRGWDFSTTKEFLKKNNFTATFVQEIKDGQESIVYPKLLEIWSENLEEGSKDYFYNRLLTDITIRRFQLGFFNEMYTIPIFQDGVLRQFQMRRDSPKIIKNYYSGVGPLLFHSEILRITDTVYITEGLIGAMLLSQYGLPAVSMNIGAEGFQASWSKYFIHVKNVIILYDNDTAGTNGAIHTSKILGLHRCKIYNFWDFDAKGFAVDDFFLDGNSLDYLNELVETKSVYPYELPEFVEKGRKYNAKK
jgi:DNA primase